MWPAKNCCSDPPSGRSFGMGCIVGGDLLFDFADHHLDTFYFIGARVGVSRRICSETIAEFVRLGNTLVCVAQVQLAFERHLILPSAGSLPSWSAPYSCLI